MRAAVLKQFNVPLVLEETPDPVAEPGWVLLRVKACGLCGTDLKIVSGMLPGIGLPLIPGHEVAGEVLEVGEGVSDVSPGDRVAILSYVTCGHCLPCQRGWETLCLNVTGVIGFSLNGGCAELIKAPAANLLPLSSKISFEEASILTDAVATTYHALNERAQARAGQTVALVGVGGLGLHAVQIAKAMGLRVFAIDVDQAHLERASKLGAEVIINSAKENAVEKMTAATGGNGVEILIEMSGSPEAARMGVSLLGLRGKMVLVGYHPDKTFETSAFALLRKEAEIYGSRGSTRRDLAKVIELVEAGKIKPMIHDVVPLSQVNQAHQKLKSGQVVGRLVLKP
jgi:2-desacetyl-2-hydroxyethyl bacteriochlorophyllide A dehydrogenase